MQKIGFIGLGNMGRGMAKNLLKKGFALTVFDLNPEPMQYLHTAGAKLAKNIDEIAQNCDVIFTMLPDSLIVAKVCLGETGLINRMKKGSILVDMSTISPETTDQLHQANSQIHVLDAPVGRLAYHAERGESLFMVGGEKDIFNTCVPYFEAMGTTIQYCGKGGAGTRTKLVNNYLAICLTQMNAEALALSQKFGLDLPTTLEVLHGTTATNGQLKINFPNKVFKGDTSAGFAIDLAHKDLTLIMEAANQARVPMPLGAAAREMFSLARAKGFGSQDFSAMADLACDLTQVERPRIG